MGTVIKVDDEAISAEQFVKLLKFSNEFSELAEKIVRNKVTVHAAKKKGIKVSTTEVQQETDDFRRYLGLHRAKNTQEWMDGVGINLDEFESLMEERVYRKKMVTSITGDAAIEEYFKLNSPKFDTLELKHIIVDSEGEAKELAAMLEDEPESFDKFAAEHSLDNETKESGGRIGTVQRGALPDEINAKVFNAAEGNIVGPFKVEGQDLYELFQVIKKKPAKLDAAVKAKVADAIYNEWLGARMQEHSVTR
jgi:peptidylprolyl isomerase